MWAWSSMKDAELEMCDFRECGDLKAPAGDRYKHNYAARADAHRGLHL